MRMVEISSSIVCDSSIHQIEHQSQHVRDEFDGHLALCGFLQCQHHAAKGARIEVAHLIIVRINAMLHVQQLLTLRV